MNSVTDKNTNKSAIGHACGKLILIGEHAVVYGQPAIATPFTLLGVKATVAQASGPLAIECSMYHGELASAPEALHGLVACIVETLRRLGSPAKDLLIRLASTIPPGRGLGSSAAVAAAAVRSLIAYHGHELPHAELMDLTNIAEVYAHGTPSGIDSEAVVAKQPLWFVKDKSLQPLPVGRPLHLVVADSGRIGDTHSAVAAVRARFKSAPAMVRERLERLGELACVARNALSTGDALHLGRTLSNAQSELAALGVSDATLNHLIQAVHKAGALGAKLTGSGHGGCVFALARDAYHAEQLAMALMQAGAKATWRLTVGEGNPL